MSTALAPRISARDDPSVNGLIGLDCGLLIARSRAFRMAFARANAPGGAVEDLCPRPANVPLNVQAHPGSLPRSLGDGRQKTAATARAASGKLGGHPAEAVVFNERLVAIDPPFPSQSIPLSTSCCQSWERFDRSSSPSAIPY